MITLEEYITIIMPKMGGWCTEEKARKIAEILTPSQNSVYVEIGVFAGRSLFAAALAMRDHGIAIGIDPWKADESVVGFEDANKDWWGKLNHDTIYNECRATSEQINATNCHLIRENSRQALPYIKHFAPIDVLHIDGNHSEESSTFDVANYVTLVRSGGTILVDDLDWPTTKRAQDLILTLATQTGNVGSCGIFRCN
jgi:predicted O-methyltransferase YrrM